MHVCMMGARLPGAWLHRSWTPESLCSLPLRGAREALSWVLTESGPSSEPSPSAPLA